ncbi:TPA: EF-P beta-lysylation protein EpmB [Providencia rettgeri]
MVDIVTQNTSSREVWIQQLAEAITNPDELLHILNLENHHFSQEDSEARKLFPLRVPMPFISRMKKGDPSDPLLLQVLTAKAEFDLHPGFSTDPLKEQDNEIPSLLHKYHNRALLLVKGGCAVNCRYCFRRHFPYEDNKGNKNNWLMAVDYIKNHTELNEIIFSGGDPLMAKDHELDWLIGQLEAIPHLKRLRIHTRLPVVIPERITDTLCKRLANSRLQVIMVTHINHANEIDEAFSYSMQKLKLSGVTLLNQSVLLRHVNDNVTALMNLSNALFDAGILPYYLHVLDKVQGAAHFLVSDLEARQLIQQLLSKVSGYLVPKLAREIGGEPSKTLLDLNLKQS